jgi:hypothetical protein
MPMLDDPAIKEDIASLEQKKLLLQQVLDVARAIETMNEGLDSVLNLEVHSKDMPQGALALFATISEHIKSLPTARIQEYQANLERLVQGQLQQILAFAGIDFERDDAIELLTLSTEDQPRTPLELLTEFKRTAQTTLSLRVLLRKRGVQTAGTPLPVPRAALEAQVERLQAEEARQRVRVDEKIVDMQSDIERMIANPAYPDGMKQLLGEVLDGLRHDRDRLRNGAPLASLDFVNGTEEIVAAPVEAMPASAPGERPADEPAPRSFTDRASRWLNSPWDVSWEDIR